MKTTKNTFWKVLGMVAIALSLVSCGKDNNSGGSSSGLNLGGYGSHPIGSMNASQFVQKVLSENPCRAGYNRRQIQMPIPNATGKLVVGKTSLGDIIVGVPGAQSATFYLCDSPSDPIRSTPTVLPYNPINGQPPVMGMSSICPNVAVPFNLTLSAQTASGYNYLFVFADPLTSCGSSNPYPPYGY